MESEGEPLAFFTEKVVVVGYFTSIIAYEQCDGDFHAFFIENFEAVSKILNKYQEQTMLLNSSLCDLCKPLTDRLTQLLSETIEEQVDHVSGFKFCTRINI
jgi:hypothetical protein